MILPRFILFLGLGLSMAAADVETRRAEALGKPMETFRTMEGRIYQDVVIAKINAGGVSFKHADGAARLRFDELSPGQREYFGISEESAAKVYREEAERREAYEKLVEKRAEERRVLAEKEAAEREDAWQTAMASAAAERSKSAREPTATIPTQPTIQRVDSRIKRSRSYGSSYRPFYGGYHNYSPYSHFRHSHRGGFRHGGFSCSAPSVVIRR